MDEKNKGMDEGTKLQWYALGRSVAVLAPILFGNVTFRIENGKYSGLVEWRETHKTESDRYETLLQDALKNQA